MKKGISLLLAAVVLAPLPLHAQDIFVRPNQPSNTAPTDLGMKPRTPPPPVAQPAAPPPVAPPVMPVTPVEPIAMPQAPAPLRPAPPPQLTPGKNPFYGDEQVTFENYGQAEVVRIRATTAEPPPRGAGPNLLTINIQPAAIGSGDKRAVAASLGLSDSEIMSNCYLHYDVLVSSGANDIDFIPLRGTASWHYNYASPLREVELSPTIACRKLRAPISGTIVEENNLYQVPLASARCVPGARGASGNITLSVRYVGDGQGQCAF